MKKLVFLSVRTFLIGALAFSAGCGQNQSSSPASNPPPPSKVENSQITVEEAEFQVREFEKKKICSLSTVETYAGLEYREYDTKASCNKSKSLEENTSSVNELVKVISILDSALGGNLTRSAKNRLVSLKSAVTAGIDAFKAERVTLQKAYGEEQERQQERSARSGRQSQLVSKFWSELKVSLNFYKYENDERAIQVIAGSEVLSVSVSMSDEKIVKCINDRKL